MNDLFSVAGKVAVVTGGSRGIGKMIASGLVDAGARVYISSRNADACATVARELSQRGECIAAPADLSGLAGAQQLASSVGEREGLVHILVNNAGATWGAPLESYPDSAFDKLWGVNVKAPFHLIRLLLPSLRKAARPQDPSRIISIGSIDGIRVPELGHVNDAAGQGQPSYENYAYSSSKAALHMLTRHLAHRLAPEHVTANVIAPGPFETKMTQFIHANPDARNAATALIPLGRFGSPEDIAGTVQFLASRAGSYITGAVLPLDGGLATHG
jgi:NAD(P)-dependent dehydrogenase (short-subunit alcohol dehydrogenase family)